MKYDLAKLMNKSLSEINKIKKKAFALPPIYIFGIEIIASGAKSAAAAELAATIGVITAGVSAAVTAATIAYIDNWDPETGYYENFGVGSNPDINDVMNTDIHNPSEYADQDNRDFDPEDYEEEVINITKEDLESFGASEKEIMRIARNIEMFKEQKYDWEEILGIKNMGEFELEPERSRSKECYCASVIIKSDGYQRRKWFFFRSSDLAKSWGGRVCSGKSGDSIALEKPEPFYVSEKTPYDPSVKSDILKILCVPDQDGTKISEITLILHASSLNDYCTSFNIEMINKKNNEKYKLPLFVNYNSKEKFKMWTENCISKE